MMAATMEAFRRSLEGKDGAEITEIAVSLFCAGKELEIQLKEYQNASNAMALEYRQMKEELDGARREIDALRKQNQHLTGIQTIQTNDLFGRSTEKTEDILNQVSVGLDHRLIRIPTENALIPKSIASASLVSQLVMDWNRMYLPLYRQESDPDRFGFALSRQTMSNWILYVARTHLRPVYEYLCALLRDYRYQNCDETYFSVVLDERGPGAKSFIWVHRSGELADAPQIVAYCYEKTRGADHLRNFYAGLPERICLTCDAYSAYSCFADESNGRIILTGCFMHCRRRYVEALLVLNLKGLTDEQVVALPETQAILLIREIYLAEGQLRDLTPEERLENRRKKVLPKVNAFFDFVRGIDLNSPLVSEKLRDVPEMS